MSNGFAKGVLAVAIGLLAAACLLSGCSKLNNKGTPPPNSAPEMFLANVPIEDSEWWRNPVVHWYATDEDGYVTKYRHIVLKAEDVPDPMLFIELSQANGFEGWTVVDVAAGETSTSGTIWLYADQNCDTCLIRDYFFIQAEDNFGSQSNVVYRYFNRGNHAPETFLEVRPGPWVTGSCCDRQFGTLGIPVSWSGEDTLDYPGRQPDFYYSWEVYGPFTGYTDSLGVHPDTDGVDWEQYIIETSWDERSNAPWVMDESVLLYNLFRDNPSVGKTVNGYFVFKVRTRDDAYVADPSDAIGAFMAIQPACEKDVMVVDMTRYGLPGPGSLYDGGNCPDVKAARDIYHPYFRGIVEEALGDTIDEFYFAWSHNSSSPPPPIELYSQFKLIILLAEDVWNGTNSAWMDFIATYMDMGGKVMLMGVDHFAWTDFLEVLPFVAYFNPNSVASRYFNVNAQFVANWIASMRLGESNEEFIEGLSLVDDLPDVSPDSSQLGYYLLPNHVWCRGQSPAVYKHNAIPGVNFFVSGGLAEGLYMAVSAYGGDGYIDGGICAYRYETPCAKSSIFGFPLWPLNRDDAVGLMKGMIDWYDIK
jgi:hypothetical protein